jgi:hypothetical protein
MNRKQAQLAKLLAEYPILWGIRLYWRTGDEIPLVETARPEIFTTKFGNNFDIPRVFLYHTSSCRHGSKTYHSFDTDEIWFENLAGKMLAEPLWKIWAGKGSIIHDVAIAEFPKNIIFSDPDSRRKPFLDKVTIYTCRGKKRQEQGLNEMIAKALPASVTI